MTTFLWWLLGQTALREKPNIIFIVADDLGWNDVSWHNPEVRTPNLEILAREGVRLENAYVQPQCTPSRSAFLTGRYPHKTGMQHGSIKPYKPYGLPLNLTTLPEALRNLGYTTHLVGKWHLGYCRWEYTPTFRGFDTFFGFYLGHQDYFLNKMGQRERGLDFRYNTKPIKQKRKGAVYSTVPIGYTAYYKHIKDSSRRKYLAMVTAMDAAIGRVVTELAKSDLLRSTVIVFTSDNGGQVSTGASNWPLRGAKGSLWEGGTRVPAFVWGLGSGVYSGLLHAVDWFPTILDMAGGLPAAGLSQEKRRHYQKLTGLTPDLDGVSHLAAFANPNKYNHSPLRKEVVYGVNDISGRYGIRYGRWKLLLGDPGSYSGWHVPGWVSSQWSQFKVHTRHRNVTLLFDLHNDPIETFNVAELYPGVVRMLRERLTSQRRQAVPALNPRSNPLAHPKFWGGVWSPGWC